MFIITKIEVQKRNKDRYNIFINDMYFGSASSYIIAKHKLTEGKKIDVESLRAAMLEDSLEKAKVYVTNYLLHKTKKEIVDKLREKGYEEETIASVMEFLEYYRLIDEKQYAKSYTSDAIRFKKLGVERIKQELKQKGIPEIFIQEAIEGRDTEEEYKKAKRSLIVKFPSYQKKAKTSYELKGKCYQYLMSRGYDRNMIPSIIEDVLKEFENEQ